MCANPIEFVVSLNLHRRHLNESQRAMVAAKIANMRREDTLLQNATVAPIGATVSQNQAAEMLNTSRRNVQRAKVVKDNGVREPRHPHSSMTPS